MEKEMVNHPDHYRAGKIECIEALKELATPEEYRGFLRLNVIKYLWRLGRKDDPVQELKKAMWYTDLLIKEYGPLPEHGEPGNGGK